MKSLSKEREKDLVHPIIIGFPIDPRDSSIAEINFESGMPPPPPPLFLCGYASAVSFFLVGSCRHHIVSLVVKADVWSLDVYSPEMRRSLDVYFRFAFLSPLLQALSEHNCH